jgi:hypothetical protein
VEGLEIKFKIFFMNQAALLLLNFSCIARLNEFFMFFLLLVQKKEPKKSTPATIYSRCRTP